MELKVREISGSQEKSQQEVEQELLDKHEDKFEDATPKEENVEKVTSETTEPDAPATEKVQEQEKVELSDSDVLSHINERYNKQINSVDELFAERESSQQLPEEVSAYLKYKQETGRGFEDYMRLNENFDDLDSDDLLRRYFTQTEDGLDAEDVEDLMLDYAYDNEFDDEAYVKKTKRAKKQKIAQAKKYFAEQKKYYKEPLESSGALISEGVQQKVDAYERQVQQVEDIKKENERKRNWFTKKTDEVFGSEFKGFEFAIDDKKLTYSPGDAQQLKERQMNIEGFISKFLNKDGLMEDAVGYHKALALAMNPEKFAKFFYEQGKSHGTDDVMRKTKNVNMTTRRTPEVTNKGGQTVRALSDSSGRGLKIKSLKRK